MPLKPRYLYLDTNILKQLNLNIQNDPRFDNLAWILRVLKIKTYIPKIVLDELIILRKKEFELVFNNLKKFTDIFNSYIDSKIPFDFKEKSKFEKEFLDKIEANIQGAEINILDNSLGSIKIDEIVEMALECKRPFNADDKGFKDMIILHSILENCKNDLKHEHIFVTDNANDFRSEDVENLIKRRGVNLRIIFSIDNLSKYLEDFLESIMKQYIENRKNNLKRFLDLERNQIEQFIRSEGAFSDNFLAVGIMPTINSIELLEISNPSARQLDNVEKGDVDVSFDVKLNFNLTSTKYEYHTPRRKLGEAGLFFTPPAELGAVEENVERTVKILGKVYIEKHGQNENYSNLRLENIIEPSDYLLQSALATALGKRVSST